MSERLRILHLEDDPDYSRFVQDLLVRGGVTADVTLVTSRADFDAALARETFDLILADYSLPEWTGIQALSIVKEKVPQTPFLLVSGTIGEQLAIESLQSGATDYVLKQWPDRLVPAVRRALSEAEERARRERAETELFRREKYFRALTLNSLDVLTVLGEAGNFKYHSPSLKRVLGYDPQELIGNNVFALIHPEDVSRARDAFQFGLQHPEQAVKLEYRIRHRDGHWVYLESVGQSRLDDPDIAAVVVNSRDVTDRKRIEHQHEVLSNFGRKLSSVTVPEEAARIIQTAADELFGWDIFMLDLYSGETDEILPVLDVDTIGGKRVEFRSASPTHPPSGLARRVIEQGAQLIVRENPTTLLPDAEPFGDTTRPSVTLMLAPIRNRTIVIGILSIHSYQPSAYTKSDLDTLQVLADYCGGALERIQAEQALRESEQRFRDLFEASPDAIFVEDLQGNVLDVNPAACRLHNLPRGQLIGKNVVELVPPDQRDSVARDFLKVASEELTRFEGESWTAEGRKTPVEIHAGRIPYAGQPAVLLHVRDISERKLAESALRSSEMLFHSVWANSVDGMRLTDENGIIVAANDAFCQLVGLSQPELQGQPFTMALAPSQQPELILTQYRERFRDRVFERQVERRLTLHNGNTCILEETSSFVELRGQPPLLLGLFRDLTQQKQLEEQFRQVQKMEAIGQLAGGVAHDFNNILTVIHGHASMLQLGTNLSGSAAKSAQQIVLAAERAAGLTRQLLTFSRRQMMQPRRLDLNEIVANVTKMLGRILGEDIVLQVDYSKEPSWVEADASMMDQVVMNLAVNARDAMPQGGQLTITIAVAEVGASHAAHNPEARRGRFVCLTATDTGTGIAPEHLRRIFEPFFSTKEVGKGTGLGLATVYGVAKQHQGWIEVESEPGRGASFRVYLPCCAAPPERVEERPAELAVRGGTETILVVEDEAAVRELVRDILEGQGYEILEAASGVKALEVWAEHKAKIDLVLTDLVMPDRINGRELAEKLWQERPSLKVIFSSGYSADVVGKEFPLQQGSIHLQKPYQPKALAQLVRECLDSKGRLART